MREVSSLDWEVEFEKLESAKKGSDIHSIVERVAHLISEGVLYKKSREFCVHGTGFPRPHERKKFDNWLKAQRYVAQWITASQERDHLIPDTLNRFIGRIASRNPTGNNDQDWFNALDMIANEVIGYAVTNRIYESSF